MFTNNIKYKKERVFRVHVYNKNGGVSTGSGFFIEGGKRFLTCFHVVFGSELSNLRTSTLFISATGTNEHDKLLNYFNNNIEKIEVLSQIGDKYELEMDNFNESFDVACLKIKDSKIDPKIKFCDIQFQNLEQGDNVFFGGFPVCAGYENINNPFAINIGLVSSFPEIVVGGGKYEHIQINTINLGGNSGAPLFRVNSNKVIGIVNGNMTWGHDNLLTGQSVTQGLQNIQPVSFRVPLSIAYATSLKAIKEKTNIL